MAKQSQYDQAISWLVFTSAYYTHAIEYDRHLEEAYIAKAFALMVQVSLMVNSEQTEECQSRNIQTPGLQPVEQTGPRLADHHKRQTDPRTRHDIRQSRNNAEEETLRLQQPAFVGLMPGWR